MNAPAEKPRLLSESDAMNLILDAMSSASKNCPGDIDAKMLAGDIAWNKAVNRLAKTARVFRARAYVRGILLTTAAAEHNHKIAKQPLEYLDVISHFGLLDVSAESTL